jgi:hypothetical protein
MEDSFILHLFFGMSIEKRFITAAGKNDVSEVKRLIPAIEKSYDPKQTFINAFLEAIENMATDVVETLLNIVPPSYIGEILSGIIIPNGDLELFEMLYPVYIKDLLTPDPITKRIELEVYYKGITHLLGQIIVHTQYRLVPPALDNLRGRQDVEEVIKRLRDTDLTDEQINIIADY